ncbi:hypothetical protein HF521_016934 [Silurus meridionalis]|uniref:Uncharacterized protein n=1 Tax=Silurus meridionalis TaxID=175797 RepID=A0A8T0BQM9_SILME|nr:hypothetical protein HF521_016934 [Silurus meridionalis]
MGETRTCAASVGFGGRCGLDWGTAHDTGRRRQDIASVSSKQLVPCEDSVSSKQHVPCEDSVSSKQHVPCEDSVSSKQLVPCEDSVSSKQLVSYQS